MSKYAWVYSPQPAKLTEIDKARLLKQVDTFIAASEKLAKTVHRTTIRGGRIYLYNLYEPWIPEEGSGVYLTKPLIDGKYFEDTYARITVYDKKGEQCTVDWQRHNNQWITLHEGSLEMCLRAIENDNDWFPQK